MSDPQYTDSFYTDSFYTDVGENFVRTLRVLEREGWVTKPPEDLDENRLLPEEVDANFLHIWDALLQITGISETEPSPPTRLWWNTSEQALYFFDADGDPPGYVNVSGGGPAEPIAASDVSFDPPIGMTSEDVQAAIEEIDDNFLAMDDAINAIPTISATPPDPPTALWFDSSDGSLYVYYDDAYVEVGGGSGGGLSEAEVKAIARRTALIYGG